MEPSLTRANPVITLRFRVKPGFIPKMRVIAHDLAVTARREHGCLFYLATESQDTPGQFLLMMIWQDISAYEHHRGSPYVRAFESQISREILNGSVTTSAWEILG